MNLKAGSVVWLKSSPKILMTVEEEIDDRIYRCCWFKGSTLASAEFAIEVLDWEGKDENPPA